MVPPTIYFFVILHIVALIRALMVKGEGLAPATTASIAVAALVLGKSVLLANALPFINRFPEKPLIWNVCWKSLIYFFVALFIHYLERLYDFWKEAPGFAAANEKLLVRDRVAARPGDPDPAHRADRRVLRCHRARACDREEGADRAFLRPAPGAAQSGLMPIARDVG